MPTAVTGTLFTVTSHKLPQNTSTILNSSHPIYDDLENCDKIIRTEFYKPHKAFDSDSVLVPVVEGAFAVQSPNQSHQPHKKKKILIATDHLSYLFNSFQWFVVDSEDLEILLPGMRQLTLTALPKLTILFRF
jgi:hypothetical protein